jgi:hypothetical protein
VAVGCDLNFIEIYLSQGWWVFSNNNFLGLLLKIRAHGRDWSVPFSFLRATFARPYTAWTSQGFFVFFVFHST